MAVQIKTVPQGTVFCWSGIPESDRRLVLGKDVYYHYTNSAIGRLYHGGGGRCKMGKFQRHSVVARGCKGLLLGDDVLEDRGEYFFEFLQKWDGELPHLRVRLL